MRNVKIHISLIWYHVVHAQCARKTSNAFLLPCLFCFPQNEASSVLELQICKHTLSLNILIWYWYSSSVQHSAIYYLRLTATFNMWPNSATALLLWDKQSLAYILGSLQFSSVLWQIAQTLRGSIIFFSLSLKQLVIWLLICCAK